MPRRITCPFISNDYQIHHPSTMLVVGSTGVGKVLFLLLILSHLCLQTTFIINSIRNKLINAKFKKIWIFTPHHCLDAAIQVNLITSLGFLRVSSLKMSFLLSNSSFMMEYLTVTSSLLKS